MVKYLVGLTLLLSVMAPVGGALVLGAWFIPFLPFTGVVCIALFRLFRDAAGEKRKAVRGGTAGRGGRPVSDSFSANTNCNPIIPQISRHVKRGKRGLPG